MSFLTTSFASLVFLNTFSLIMALPLLILICDNYVKFTKFIISNPVRTILKGMVKTRLPTRLCPEPLVGWSTTSLSERHSFCHSCYWPIILRSTLPQAMPYSLVYRVKAMVHTSLWFPLLIWCSWASSQTLMIKLTDSHDHIWTVEALEKRKHNMEKMAILPETNHESLQQVSKTLNPMCGLFNAKSSKA